MKKKNLILCLVLTICMICSLSITSFAADGTGSVKFTSDSKMVDNFGNGEVATTVSDLEPGQSVSFSVSMKNENKNSTDWYMENKVLKTLEEISDAAKNDGGIYSYKLTYNGPTGSTDIIDSKTVGSAAGGEGLKDATKGLEDWFYVGTLASGQSGNVTLSVTLDPETQGNSYQDATGKLNMKFAVEEQEPGSTTTTGKLVETGDESNLPMWIALTAASALLLAISIFMMAKRRKEEKDEENC